MKIEDLLALGSGESLTLELKSSLPEFSDKGKAELLKDVSAMANALGGSILYGVEEDDGKAASLAGLNIGDKDQLIRRIAQVVQAGIEPQIPAPRIYVVEAANGDVLVIEVGRSFDGPHRFKFNNNFRFVVRHDRHVSDLSYDQLRATFSRTARRMDRIQELWQEEFSRTSFWRPVVDEGLALVRLASISSAEGNQVIDPKRAHDHWSKLMMPQWGGASPAFNYDGLAVHQGGDQPLKAFMQVHRVGAISSWRGIKSFHSDENIFYGGYIAGFLRNSFRKQKMMFDLLQLDGPFVLNFGLRNVSKYRMVTVDGYGFEEEHRTHMDEIVASPVWIEDIRDVDENSVEIFKGPLDLLWQAFGQAGCPIRMLEEELA